MLLTLSILLLIAQSWAASLSSYPLNPVNTSGPKDTLRTFLVNSDKAFAEFQRFGYRTKDALRYTKWASKTMDLSNVPPALRNDAGFESTLRLKEILNNAIDR